MRIHEEILNLVVSKPDWVETLETIVKNKKLDPNNINIKEIVSYYIEFIQHMESKDLNIPGNLLLAASILLRIKTYMTQFKEKKKIENIKIRELKEPLIKIRKKRITLNDLIETVKDIIKKDEEIKLKKAKKTDESLDSYFIPFEVSDDFIDSSFNYIDEIVEEKEDFEAFIGDVLYKINLKKDGENIVLFSSLIKDTEDILLVCKTFVAVLHLANKGILVLWQEDHFNEIIIKLVDENEGKIENN